MINKILTEQELEAISGGEGKTIPQAVYCPKDGSCTMVLFKNHDCASTNSGFRQKMNIKNWGLALESWQILGDCSKLAEAAVEIGETLPIGAEFILIKISDEWELYKRAN